MPCEKDNMAAPFVRLLEQAAELGKVSAAHLYDDWLCVVEGVTEAGKLFTLTLTVEDHG